MSNTSHTDDSWGPWTEHDGKGCPCIGALVRVELVAPTGRVFSNGLCAIRKEMVAGGEPRSWYWSNFEKVIEGNIYPKLTRYRIRKPRGMAVLDAIMADPLRAPAKEGVE